MGLKAFTNFLLWDITNVITGIKGERNLVRALPVLNYSSIHII